MKTMKLDFVNNVKFRYAIGILWGIIVLCPIVGSMFRVGVFCDSAYYICMAERITEGYIPYITLHLGYTPLWIYIMAAFKCIFHIPNGLYWPYLLLFYICEIGTSYVLYRLMQKMNINRDIAFVGATLFLLAIHWLQGNCVMLEIPFLFWGLLSCLLIFELQNKNSWWYLLVGIFSCFSFLSKQFGLGFLVLDLYVILFLIKGDWKKIGTYLLGYSIPIAICLIIWGWAFVECNILNGYGTRAAEEAGYDTSLLSKLEMMWGGIEYFAKFSCPVLIFSLLYLPDAYKQKRLANFIFAYCGIFGFSLQFYFARGDHYSIPLVPFGIILLSEMLMMKNNKWLTWLKYILLVVTICISLYKTYYNRVYKLYCKKNEFMEQVRYSNEIKSYISNDETLFVVHGSMFYVYFMADVLPPNMRTIGYSFGPMGLNEETCGKQIMTANLVLRYSEDYPYESEFTDSLKSVLETYPIVWQNCDSTMLLHRIK